MITGYSIVEGQTESAFYDRVLNPYLQNYDVYLQPIIIYTGGGKGGAVSFQRINNDLRRVMHNSNAQILAVSIDLHRIHSSFPGNDHTLDSLHRAESIQNSIKQHHGDRRLFPFVQTYDFEAFLFSDPSKFCELGLCSQNVVNQLNEIKRDCGGCPERINSDQPPSYRIERLIPAYKKTVDGPSIASSIGIEQIKAECQHFNSWLNDIIAFANSIR